MPNAWTEKQALVYWRCREVALGRDEQLMAVREAPFHAELLAESAARLVRFRIAQAKARLSAGVQVPGGGVIVPRLQARPGAKGRRRK